MHNQPFTVEVGKSGNQPFPITCRFVSNKHCTITYNPAYQNFTVIDHSQNGTWIVDDSQGLGNLNFYPVTNTTVPMGTWLNLGGTDPGNGHRLLVDHLLAEPDDYSAEFRHYNMMLSRYHDELEALDAEQRRKQNIVIWARTGITLAAVVLLYVIFKIQGPAMILVTTLSMAVTNLFNPNTSAKAKLLRRNVGRYFICPKCGRQLNEFAINSLQCPCGAK